MPMSDLPCNERALATGSVALVVAAVCLAASGMSQAAYLASVGSAALAISAVAARLASLLAPKLHRRHTTLREACDR
jgi:F0F1-type ATP synthase assembly protein I